MIHGTSWHHKCRGAIKCNAVGIFSIAFGWRGLLAYVYSGVFV